MIMRRSVPSPTPSIITDSLCGSSTRDETTDELDHSPPKPHSEQHTYLTVLLDDESIYEWFVVTDSLLNSITLDQLRAKVDKYFGIPNCDLADIDGPLVSTSDLRRCLRSACPTIRIREGSRDDEVSETSPCSTIRNSTADLLTRSANVPFRIVLRKRNQTEYFGFSNVPSRDNKALVITHVHPEGLLARMNSRIQVGDLIVSINGISGDPQEMRRELLVSTIIDIHFKPNSFILEV
jgi:hypothetical protein